MVRKWSALLCLWIGVGVSLTACGSTPLLPKGPEATSSSASIFDQFAPTKKAKTSNPIDADAMSIAPRHSGAVQTEGATITARPSVAMPNDVEQPQLGAGYIRANVKVANASAGTVNLNFEDVELKTVVQAILGEVLKLNYSVDANVSGKTMSLSARRPVRQEHLLTLLETALRAQGVIMVEEAGVYRIIPDAQGQGRGQANIGLNAGKEGYGITALPLENISPDAVISILYGMEAAPKSVRSDKDRNLIIIEGTFAERARLVDAALTFDVDWMRNQSVAILPVRDANPGTIITELKKLAVSRSVTYHPIDRMNAIMAVSTSSTALREVTNWVGQLDRTDERRMGARVYRLKYLDARKVVALLKEIFSQGSAGATASSHTQVDPAAGTITTTTAAAQSAPAGPPAEPGTGDPSQAASPSGGEAEGGNGTIRFAADLTNNAVVVYSDLEKAQLVERAIRDLDRKQTQVAIEATIAEVTLNDNLRNGVQFFLTSKAVGLGADHGSVSNLLEALPISRVVPGLNLLLGKEASPKLVLDALREITDVKILSSPSVVVLNNEPAILQVGDQVPITTRSAQDVTNPLAPVVNSITMRDTGVILRVTPRLHANSLIGIDIEQEISAVKDPDAQTLTPTISQRRVKSTVTVENSQTLLIGGLISEQRNKSNSGIPGLIEIPYVGDVLGGLHTRGKDRTELIVFIRPQLIRDQFDAHDVAEGLRQKMKGFDRW